ncbi:MAG: S-layer homology domain-containing protein [Bacillota bacterium]
MMKYRIQTGILLLVLVFTLYLSGTVFAATSQEIDAAITDTAQYITKTVKAPQVGSTGGEWAVIGLARSGCTVPDNYYSDYYQTVVKYVKDCDGVLHEKKYTEYSRLILGLTAAGYDARDVGGYNLTTALGDFDKTIWQGINGPVFALIALDSANYPMPQNPEAVTQATRDMYVDEILRRQLSDGGFSLLGGGNSAAADEKADPDITGMALQALAKYQDRADVKQATEKALACLSALQDSQGGYSSWGAVNSESCVQVIVALTELGIPLDDPRFVKDGNTLLDNLLTFYQKGKGFQHTADGDGDSQMSTEQGFYALVSAQRVMNGKNSLYRMDDVVQAGNLGTIGAPPINGLEGKDPSVRVMPVTMPGMTFPDISGHENQSAIEALAARDIINGKTETAFDPDATMTRAEFAAIVVRGLGLTPEANNTFADVSSNEWYAGYIGTANTYGIVNGNTETTFNPLGTITRQDAATMVARAAKLCGMETEMETGEIRDMLAQFGDYVQSADWARASLAFCYREDILSQEALEIQPMANIKRCEIAQMLYNLLAVSQLL